MVKKRMGRDSDQMPDLRKTGALYRISIVVRQFPVSITRFSVSSLCVKSFSAVGHLHQGFRRSEPVAIFFCVTSEFLDDNLRSDLVCIFEQSSAERRKSDAENKRCIEKVRHVYDLLIEAERSLFYHQQHCSVHDFIVVDLFFAS